MGVPRLGVRSPGNKATRPHDSWLLRTTLLAAADRVGALDRLLQFASELRRVTAHLEPPEHILGHLPGGDRVTGGGLRDGGWTV